MKKLKAISIFVLCFALLFSSTITVSAAQSAKAATLRLEKTQGTVTVTNASGTSKKATQNMKLLSGYTVSTGKASYAYISLDSSKALKLDASSKVSIHKAGKKLEVKVVSGKVMFNVSAPLTSQESLTIRTSTMVTGVRGTAGWFESDQTSSAVYLLEGSLDVYSTGRSKPTNITSGQQMTSQAAAAPGTSDTPTTPDGSGSTGETEVPAEVKVESFTTAEVPGFVAAAVAEDTSLQNRMQDKGSPIDAAAVASVAEEKLKQDETAAAKQEQQIQQQEKESTAEAQKNQENTNNNLFEDNKPAAPSEPPSKPKPKPTPKPLTSASLVNPGQGILEDALSYYDIINVSFQDEEGFEGNLTYDGLVIPKNKTLNVLGGTISIVSERTSTDDAGQTIYFPFVIEGKLYLSENAELHRSSAEMVIGPNGELYADGALFNAPAKESVDHYCGIYNAGKITLAGNTELSLNDDVFNDGGQIDIFCWLFFGGGDSATIPTFENIDGTVTVHEGAGLYNYAQFYNHGTLCNEGEFTNNGHFVNTFVLQNSGAFTSTPDGWFPSEDYSEGGDMQESEPFGTISTGSIYNFEGATINVSYGTMSIRFDTEKDTGYEDALINEGEIIVEEDCEFLILGEDTTFSNLGYLENNGLIQNQGKLYNTTTDTTLFGTIRNEGEFLNMGYLQNSGSVTVDDRTHTPSIQNSGSLKNLVGTESFEGENGEPITKNFVGSIHIIDGNLNNEEGSTFLNDSPSQENADWIPTVIIGGGDVDAQLIFNALEAESGCPSLNHGYIQINPKGWLIVNDGATFSNLGTIINDGYIKNHGSMFNSAETMSFDEGNDASPSYLIGYIENSGTFHNFGELSNISNTMGTDDAGEPTIVNIGELRNGVAWTTEFDENNEEITTYFVGSIKLFAGSLTNEASGKFINDYMENYDTYPEIIVGDKETSASLIFNNTDNEFINRSRITINETGTLTISKGCTLTNRCITFEADSETRVMDTIQNRGIIKNYGTLNTEGAITNDGSFTNVAGAVLEIRNDGRFFNSNTFENFGTIENYNIFENFATFKNLETGIINNYSFFGNGNNTDFNGTIENFGEFSTSGEFKNLSEIKNHGTIDNTGKFFNNVIEEGKSYGNGKIDNYGIITNTGDGEKTGIFENFGSIENKNWNGTLGSIENDGSIKNNVDGTIHNYGVITNDSNGRIENNSTIENKDYDGVQGSIVNDGNVTNNADGFIDNYGIITNNSAGTIENYGTIKNKDKGTVVGDGKVTGNGIEPSEQ